jgi:hypothetical protein
MGHLLSELFNTFGGAFSERGRQTISKVLGVYNDYPDPQPRELK